MTDINIPVIKAILIPFFEGIFLDIGFFSTLRYQIVGTKKIHILHVAKKICEINSSSMILIPKITDIDGTKPTNNIAIKGKFHTTPCYYFGKNILPLLV